jgi:hypothetical protein
MMPRRPAIVMPKIPLFLIASMVSREVKEAGEELVRIVVKKVKGHYYDISVRTRKLCRALRAEVPKSDPAGCSRATREWPGLSLDPLVVVDP